MSAILAALTAVFFLLNIGYKYFTIYKYKWLGGILTHLILFLTGWVAVINCNELNSSTHFSKSHADYLVVKINNEPKRSCDMLKVSAEVENNLFRNKTTASTGNLLITIKTAPLF